MTHRKHLSNRHLWLTSLLIALCCATMTLAQTTEFTYQGKLTDAGNPANSNFDCNSNSSTRSRSAPEHNGVGRWCAILPSEKLSNL